MIGVAKVAKVQEVEIDRLKPYEKNTKIHGEEQIEKLCESIRQFGFISPVLIDGDMNVIAGHGRLMAAKRLRMEKVPCLLVDGLTEKQRRAYIIADNRLGEYSEWNLDLVAEEIGDLQLEEADISFLEFQFDKPEEGDEEPEGTDGTEEDTSGKKWTTRGARCDMKLNIAARVKNGHWYTSLHAVSKSGKTLEEIKNDKKCEKQLVDELADFITKATGGNLAVNGWAMITTGRRRHREGYHFATEVTRKAAKRLGIPFYEGAISCGNANRLKPALTIQEKPKEKNLILFDDIITTGTTAARTAELLAGEGYTVITIIGIRNQ